jgi:hypothetical protein
MEDKHHGHAQSAEQALALALFLRSLLSFMADQQQAREQDELPRAEPTTPPPPLPLPPAPLPAHTTVAPASRRRRLLPQLRRQEARRGMILMTVLGPCRALEPSSPPQQ